MTLAQVKQTLKSKFEGTAGLAAALQEVLDAENRPATLAAIDAMFPNLPANESLLAHATARGSLWA